MNAPFRRTFTAGGLPKLNRQSPQASGLLRWWPMTFAAGDGDDCVLYDCSGHGVHAAPRVSGDGNSFDPTAFGDHALNLGPTDQGRGFEIPASGEDGLTGQISVCAWARRDGSSNGDHIFSRFSGGQSRFKLAATVNGTANAVSFFVGADGSPEWVCPLGEWFHLVGTYDGAAVRLYANGVEVGSGTPKTGTFPGDGTTGIGAYFNASGWEWPGLIRDLRLYSRALSPGEVWAIFDPATRGDLWRVQQTPTWIPSPGSGEHFLSPAAVDCPASLEAPALAQLHIVSALEQSVGITFDQAAGTQVHHISPANVSASAGVDAVSVSEGVSVLPLALDVTPDVEHAGLTQIYSLGTAEVMSSVASGSPALMQFHMLSGGTIAVSAILITAVLALVSEGAPEFRTTRLTNDRRGIGISSTNRTSSISE